MDMRQNHLKTECREGKHTAMTPTIVVPLDGSTAAESALPFARMLAQRRNAPLILASVVNVTPEFATWLNTGVEEGDREIGAWVEDRRTYLKQLVDVLSDVNVQAHVSVGSPTKMLVEFIDQVEDAVIVMASHGHAQPHEGRVGRRTTRLIQFLNDPIVVVKTPPEGSPLPVPEVTRVLIPLDGSAFSEEALEATLRILGEPFPSLHLVHVIENTETDTGRRAEGVVGHYFEEARVQHSENLQGHAATLTRRGYTITWEVREGPVAKSIADAAADSNASMIAMSTHGGTGIISALLGSVAEGVLHITDLPLLLIRPMRE